MKHLYAGLIVGGILAALVAATLTAWWFFDLFISTEAAAFLTGIIIGVILMTTVVDFITEKRESA